MLQGNPLLHVPLALVSDFLQLEARLYVAYDQLGKIERCIQWMLTFYGEPVSYGTRES